MAGLVVSALLVATMQWPGGAQGDTSTSTQAPQQQQSTTTTTAPSTTTTEAPTTTSSTEAPTTEPPTTAGGGGGGGGGETTTTAAPAPTTSKAEAAVKARQIDASSAKLEDLANALSTLNKQVVEQAAKSNYATQQLAAAEAKVAETDKAVAAAEADLQVLEGKLRGEAIRAFMGDGSEEAAVIITGDPNTSIRMQTMLAEVTQSGIDLSTTLQTAHEDLEVQKAEAMNAKEEAEALKADAGKQLSLLQGDRQDQVKLALAAESRLEQLLTEEAGNGVLANDPSTAAAWELVRQLRASLPSQPSSAPPPGQDIPVPASISAADIVLAGNGIYVHVTIASNVKRLLADAAAAGYNLSGGGYRDPSQQIAVRKSNCGTSNYAIYQMPASSCSPPTARPGQSMHEKGLAIDFNWNGDLIKSRSNPAWVWLNAHASAYGLYNLPSEPWHWSSTGQ